MTTYDKLDVCSLTKEQHERTCSGYWYTVTSGATAHTAFAHKAALLRWAAERGLTIDADAIPEPGTWSVQRLGGSYRSEAHMDPVALDMRPGLWARTFSNGDVVDAKITVDEDGIRTVHTLNPNVKDRRTYDYTEADAELT